MRPTVFIPALILALGPLDAAAHDFYARECCTDHDCRPAAPGEVVQTPNGCASFRRDEVFPSWATRRSPDGRIHRCTKDADPAAMTICLYVPDLGM